MRKILFSISILFSFSGFTQIAQVREWTKTLCSPEMQGRGYVLSGDSLVANFLAKEYEKLGLTPIPGQNSMFQNFSFPVNTFPGDMELKLNSQTLVPGQDFIVDPASGSFSGKANYVVLKGNAIFKEENLNAILYKNMEKSLNCLVADLSDLKGDSLEKAKARLENWANSIAIVELFSGKFTWSVAQEAFRFPYILLRDSIWKTAPLEISVQNLVHNSHAAKNVIAYLPAKKKTNQTIFFTAHYDHLGRMGRNTYFPGGNDNASGSAMLLSLASFFKNNPLKYNLVFVAFAGEEVGLLGSRFYNSNPILPLADIRFLINLDIMGSGEEGITAVNATLFPKEFKILQKINKKGNWIKSIKSRGPAANSDHYFFTQNGVPAFFIYTMGPNKHYHDIYDTYEELSFAEYADLTELLKRFVQKL